MSNTFVEVTIKATFVHPSGMQYKGGSRIKLTPVGVTAWLKEGWIIDPAPAAIPVGASVSEPTPPPAA